VHVDVEREARSSPEQAHRSNQREQVRHAQLGAIGDREPQLEQVELRDATAVSAELDVFAHPEPTPIQPDRTDRTAREQRRGRQPERDERDHADAAQHAVVVTGDDRREKHQRRNHDAGAEQHAGGRGQVGG
jgi:hypothetical protein